MKVNSELLKIAIRDNGFSNKAFAKQCGLSANTINKVCSKGTCLYETLVRICATLGMNPVDFIPDDNHVEYSRNGNTE